MNTVATHTRRMYYHACVWLCALAVVAVSFVPAQAQESLSVSVTPPLIQLTIGPGEFWSSTIKVVNNNPYDVTYYATVVDFEAEGEGGKSKFVPLVDDPDRESRRTFSLASWVEVSSEPVRIPRGMSREIPFSVNVPEDAEPGGHYAAILVGTQPGVFAEVTGPSVKVSSFVSSLLFARISGEVVESGRIREFTASQSLYQKPHADFLLRFENTGNTHLQPQGDITIYNMWGKERGKVFINQKTNFGHVLPQSTRKFEFTWSGESDPFDIGRHSAIVTLGYGEDGRHNVTAKTYFWVVPVIPVAIVLGVVSMFVILISWFIRVYIRRALSLERARTGAPIADAHTNAPIQSSVAKPQHVSTLGALVEPLKEGVVDLRSISLGKKDTPAPLILSDHTPSSQPVSEGSRSSHISVGQFVHKYRLFFLFVGVIAIGIAIGWWYFSHALVPEKKFEISGVSLEEEPINEGNAE